MSVPRETEKALARNAESASGRRVAALFDEHARMVLGVCRRHLRDIDDAEDAAQQTFLRAYRSLLGGAHPQNAAAWLRTIASNECRTRIARRRSAPPTVPLRDASPDVPTADVQTHAERRAELDALTSALAELPERQREAVVLRDVYGLSYDQVATAMSVSEPAVDSLLSRGRRTLARRVAPVRAAGGLVVVPPSLRDELARLVPGFSGADGAAVAGGGAAVGVVAKLTAMSAAGKAAAVTAAVTVAVSAPAVVDGFRGPDARIHTVAPAAAAADDQPKTSPPNAVSSPAAERLPGARNGASPSGAPRAEADDRSSSGSGSVASTSSGSGSSNSGSGSETSGSGSGSSDSGSGSSGSGSSSGPGSTSSGSGSTSSGSGSTSSDSESSSSGSTSSRSGSSGSGTSDSSSGSTSSGSDLTSSGSGSTSSGSGSSDAGSGSSDSGSGSTTSSSGSGDD